MCVRNVVGVVCSGVSGLIVNKTGRAKYFISALLCAAAVQAPAVMAAGSKDPAKSEPVKSSVKAVEDVCENLLLTADASELDDFNARLEKHSLVDLVVADPKKNLAVQHPAIVQNAFQRFDSWVRFGGVRSMPDPNYGAGQIRVYPIFSDGLPESGGANKRIIGQYKQIESIVNYIHAGALGSGAIAKMPLLTGPPGTGKTEFLQILTSVSRNLGLKHPEYFLYTYDWVDLKDIPEVYPVLNVQPDGKGGEYIHPMPCPLGHSPFVLLPPAFQGSVIKAATDRSIELSGTTPNPNRDPCPHCMKIREAILKHYAEIAHKTHLSPLEQLNALKNHVVVRRRVDTKLENLTKLDAQGKDPDYMGLFFQPRALLINEFGPGHPFSYFLNGAVLRSDGKGLLLDEFPRNPTPVRDLFLEVIENKVVRRGGAPAVPLDAVIIAAGNTSSIEKAMQEDGNSTQAHLDRSKLLPMFLSIQPHEIGKTMLLMINGKQDQNLLIQQPLSLASPKSESAEGVSGDKADLAAAEKEVVQTAVPAVLEDLFPMPKNGEKFVGPDHRYGVWMSTGPKTPPVHIAPHTLMYMAMVTAATRLETDPAAAHKVGNYKVIDSANFQSEIDRLKILMGDKDITVAERQELSELHDLLKEGTNGLSARDAANIWLADALSEAQKPENGNCLTPWLAKEVLLRLMDRGGIQFGLKGGNDPTKIRAKWKVLSDRIAEGFLVPAVSEDVTSAVNHGQGSIDTKYDEIYKEILALQKDETVTKYKTEGGEWRDINKNRLAEIEQYYREVEHRPLARGEIMNFHSEYGRPVDSGRRHPGLLAAINRYLSKRQMDLNSFEQVVQVTRNGDGTNEMRAQQSAISQVLQHEHGYCPVCMKKALQASFESASKTRQVGQ